MIRFFFLSLILTIYLFSLFARRGKLLLCRGTTRWMLYINEMEYAFFAN